jgi:succinate dehydrogenase / fumarate reductase flavoprotein subunit
MQRAMQSHCGVFRTEEIMSEGTDKLSDCWDARDDVSVSDRSLIWNSDLIETLELDNLMVNAVASLHSALNRTETRGAHARDDYTERDDDDWMHHTTIWVDEGGNTDIGERPVTLTPLTNDIAPIPPKKRVY